MIFISTNSWTRGGSCRHRRRPCDGHLPALVIWWWPAPEGSLEQNEAAHLPSFWRSKVLHDWTAPVCPPSSPLLRWVVSFLRNSAVNLKLTGKGIAEKIKKAFRMQIRAARIKEGAEMYPPALKGNPKPRWVKWVARDGLDKRDVPETRTGKVHFCWAYLFFFF